MFHSIISHQGHPPIITNVYKSPSNKYVDITFDYGVYTNATRVDPVTTSNFSIVNLVAGGVTAISISSVKRNNSYIEANGLALIGGENTVRLFITLTGTPDSTESFQVRCTGLYSGFKARAFTADTRVIKINITPAVLFDFHETASVSTLSLGVDNWTDVMNAHVATQATDANRPIDGGDFMAFNNSLSHSLNAGTVVAAQNQKGNNFTVVISGLKSLGNGITGWIVSNRGTTGNNQGWSISVGVDNSLFFVLRDTTTQGVADYDAFTPNTEDTYFFVNNNGTLNIYNSAGTTLGTTGNATGIGTITYTSVSFSIGRQPAVASTFFYGSLKKIALVSRAMTLDERTDFYENCI